MRDRLSSRDFFEPADDSESCPDLLSVAVEEFCKHHDNARDWSAKTSREIRAILALFLRIVADQGVADFDNRKTSDYVRTILTLPPNINKSLRYASKSISEMLGMGDKSMSTTTARKNIQRVSRFFKWAVKRGYTNDHLSLTARREAMGR